MESLRRLRSKVFTKKPSTPLTNKVVSAPKKPRDKRLRHSQSMPLQNIANIEETYIQSRPVYRGKHPLKASDVQLVVDSRGCPDVSIQHPAFDPVVEQCTFSSLIEKSSREDVLDKFPAPPPDKPLPRRPKVAAPLLDLYDDLPPLNPAFERQQLLCAARAQIHGKPYRKPIVERSQSTTSSRAYHDIVPPQDWAETTVSHDGHHGREGGSQTIMTHSNYSTKSLGANIRLKDGPARRVVVNQPARYDPRPRLHSGASSGSIMDTAPLTSSRRHAMEPRQRHISNASTTTRQGTEFGYISQADPHYHRTPSTASPPRPSRPPKSPYRP